MALLGGNTERQICDYYFDIRFLFYFILFVFLFCFVFCLCLEMKY